MDPLHPGEGAAAGGRKNFFSFFFLTPKKSVVNWSRPQHRRLNQINKQYV